MNHNTDTQFNAYIKAETLCSDKSKIINSSKTVAKLNVTCFWFDLCEQ